MDVITWINSNASFLLVIITAIYASFTFFLLRTNSKMHKASFLPQLKFIVLNYNEPIKIKNIGKGPAINISIEEIKWCKGAQSLDTKFKDIPVLYCNEEQILQTQSGNHPIGIVFRDLDILKSAITFKDILGNTYKGKIHFIANDMYVGVLKI